jgi:hypothetical protein
MDTSVQWAFRPARRKFARSLTVVVTPPNPSWPSTTSKGTVVATLQGTWDDGSAFVGDYIFASPNFNDGGVYAMTLNSDHSANLIIDPNGPGVGSAGGTIEHVTIEARS